MGSSLGTGYPRNLQGLHEIGTRQAIGLIFSPQRGEQNPLMWGFIPHAKGEGISGLWLLLQFKSRTTASHYQCSLSLPSGIVPLPPSQKTWEQDHDVEHSPIR